MSMTIQEAIKRINEHMSIHHIGQYPHIHLAEAMQMALDALREKADHLIANGVTLDNQIASSSKQVASSEWISVKDRLPEEWQKVLVFVPSIDVITIAKLRGGYWYATWDSMRIDNVGYWLPLPQPPKD